MESDPDISFVSSGRPSTDRSSSVALDFIDSCLNARLSTSSETSFGSIRSGQKFNDLSSLHEFSSFSHDSARTSFSGSSQNLVWIHFQLISIQKQLVANFFGLYLCFPQMQDDMEAEMRRLKLELKQTMDMYSTACKEALTAKQKVTSQLMFTCKLEEEEEEADYQS